MNTLKMILLLLLAASSLSAFAKGHPVSEDQAQIDPACLEKKRVLFKTESPPSSGCLMVEDLTLHNKLVTYPKLHPSPMDVQYWKGKFKKSRRKIDFYQAETTNKCTGQVQVSDERNFETVFTKIFALDNPNFDRDHDLPILLNPMTETEARRAFDELKAQCEAFDLKPPVEKTQEEN